MEKINQILNCNSIDDIPTIEQIQKLPRNVKLILVFDKNISSLREKNGTRLKLELPGFLVGIHTQQPEINISKLITESEIEQNAAFFEKCAKDYRQLAEKLIFELATSLNTTLNKDFPLLTFNQFKTTKQQIGTVGEWKYFLHGYHCGFKNIKTKQCIKVPLVFGLEFGDLDPYFFSLFIKSTKKYFPLPTEIFEDFADGEKILDKMVQLGKFEKINSNILGHFGVAVTDREKIKINVYEEETPRIDNTEFKLVKPKFNLWTSLGLKK